MLKDINNALLLKYSAQTEDGMNGGPVYVDEAFIRYQYNIIEKQKTVIGINSDKIGSYNIGTRINCQHLKFYYDNPNITT